MGVRAKESHQVEKARRKLQKKFAKEEGRMTHEALRQMALLIEQQLARHAAERIDLKSKEIALFDANRHPAAVKSKFVSHLLSSLKAETKQPQSVKQLKGRITTS